MKKLEKASSFDWLKWELKSGETEAATVLLPTTLLLEPTPSARAAYLLLFQPCLIV